MTENNEKKKNKLHWLLWTGLIALVLVVGLGPLIMLISFTRMENTGQSSFWERFQGNGYERSVEDPPDVQDMEPYMVQYLFRYCEHGDVYHPGEIPEDYPAPPRVLADIAVYLHNGNLSIDNLMDDPQNWYLVNMKEGSEKPYFLLTYLNDFCPECQDKFYLGVFNDRIAVFQGEPPNGKMVELTDYRVKEIDREELEQGVPFNDEEEKNNFLLMFTS